MRDIENMLRHLREDIDYPASREELLEACDNLDDIAPEDRVWFTENLPDGEYDSPEDVILSVGMTDPAAQRF